MTQDLLPAYTTPDKLAEHLQVPERTLRQLARKLGACSEMGKRMILTARDVETLMEATRPCPSPCTAGRAGASGTTEAPLPDGGYEALRRLRTRQEPKGSRRKGSKGSGHVISMDRERR